MVEAMSAAMTPSDPDNADRSFREAEAGLPDSFHLDASGARLRLGPRDPTFFQNPYPAYAELHRRAPIVFWEEFGCLAVADYGQISAILRDRRFGRVLPSGDDGRPDLSGQPATLQAFYDIERHSLLDLEPPTHTRLRALVTRAFVSRRIERLAPRIEAVACSLVDGFIADGTADLVEAYATPLAVTIIAELIGFGEERHGDMLAWSHAMVAMYQFGRTQEIERRAEEASRDFAAFIRAEIAEKRRHPCDDLVSALVASETEGGRLDEDEMVSTLVLLMNAGHEATVHQVGNAMKAILGSGVDAAEMAGSDEALALVVEEALRFDTPLHLFKRVALTDMTLETGETLVRGQEIALLLGAGNHDPKVFPEPQRFDPARRGPPNLSFGAGIHFCIGAPLARLEIRIALAVLLRRLRGLRVNGVPRYRDSYHFRGLEQLRVAFEASEHPLRAGQTLMT